MYGEKWKLLWSHTLVIFRTLKTGCLKYLRFFWIHIFFMALEPLLDQGLLNVEASQSHSDTPHSVRLLWTSDKLDAENSAWPHTHTHTHTHTHITHIRQTSMFPARFEPAIPTSVRPQTYPLDRAATGISDTNIIVAKECLLPMTVPALLKNNRKYVSKKRDILRT